MKLQPNALPPLLSNPAKCPTAFLVYGPEEGRVSETISGIAKALESSAPIVVRKAPASEVTSGELLIGDELRAVSLLGDKTLLHITDAGDSLTKHIDGTEGAENILVIEAGSLGPRSSLRLLFEKAAHMAAVPCYVEEGRALEGTVRTLLAEEQLQADHDATTAIAALAGGNQRVLRQEITKLALYKGTEDKQVTLDDVQACLAAPYSEQLDQFVAAIFDGHKAVADRLLTRLLAEGTASIQLIRMLVNHAMKLLALHGHIQQGKGAEQAMAALRPPVFFKQKPVLQRQLQRWQPAQLTLLLGRLMEDETRLKSLPIDHTILMCYAMLRASGSVTKKVA